MIKVVLVDDSAIVRRYVGELFQHLKDMELIASIANPLELPDFLKTHRPDVLILDVQMPHMDGITLLQKIMKSSPIPTVMFSSHTGDGSENAVRALQLGAVEVVNKDRGEISAANGMWDELVLAIRSAASVNINALDNSAQSQLVSHNQDTKPQMLPEQQAIKASKKRWKAVVIGASTGGTQALELLLKPLQPLDVPIVIVQHMPEHFTTAFAKRLNSICALPVKEAVNGEKIKKNEIVIAPGGKHLRIKRKNLDIITEVKEGPSVSHHCPSVDVLFESAAEVYGRSTIAILLTGMGHDGADGMKQLHQLGAYTMAQDEASSVVFGMPAAAIRKGAATAVVPLDRINFTLDRAFIENSTCDNSQMSRQQNFR